MEIESIAEPNPKVMQKYDIFVKIKETQRDTVLEILEKNDIDSPSDFKSPLITQEVMLSWGLSDGQIVKLAGNVTRFEKSKSANQ